MIVRTPLLPFSDGVWLKLETLQPIGSFKIRGAMRAVDRLPPDVRAKGVVTASAGNMAQGVALAARVHGVPATILMPDTAPRAKIEAVERLGATIVKMPYDEWWTAIETRREPNFIHPVDNDDVIEGNGSIGTEILEDLPRVEQVLVPWGGGGLSCGIARAVGSRARVYACEVATAAPFAASLAAGRPVAIERTPSFVDGIGGRSVLPRMWERAQGLIAGSLVAPLDEVKAAVKRLLEKAHVLAEGAGAVPVACLSRAPKGATVCVISGGNIDREVLRELL